MKKIPKIILGAVFHSWSGKLDREAAESAVEARQKRKRADYMHYLACWFTPGWSPDRDLDEVDVHPAAH